MKRAMTLLAALTVAVVSSGAAAREWWADAAGESAIEGWGYLKDSLMAVHFLGIDLYPAEAGGQNSTRFRIGMDAYYRTFKFSTEIELSCDAAFEGLTDGLVTGFGSTASRPRLWDPDPWRQSGVTLSANIDRLYFRVSAGPVDITVGRQAISWGSAWFWKPTDRFAPFSPVDIDPDVKRGVDAFRMEAYLSATTSLDLIATFERHADDDELPVWTNAGTRLRTTIGRYDIAFSLARFQATGQGNWMIGAEFQGELPKKVGFRGEIAINVMEESRDWDIEAVAGVDYTFRTRTTLAAEVMFNGYGVSDAREYIRYLSPAGAGERLARGEAFNMGRYYAGLAVRQEINPLLSLSFSAIANLADPSAVFTAGLVWSAAEDVRVSAGLLIPAGERPEVPTLATLWAVPLINSEYGLMPVLGYMVIKYSF